MAKDAYPLGLNPFGEVLRELMRSRGITSWAELVTEHGYPCTAEEVWRWTHDTANVCRDTED